MISSDYDKLSWPARVRLARLALPKGTKKALADELATTVHTIVNWEHGKCVPKSKTHRERIKDLCENGISVSGAKISVNFLLGGFDANEAIVMQPLLTRDKSATTLVLLAIATRLAEHLVSVINKTVLVTSIDTVFNTYPSYVNLYATPVILPDTRFLFRLSHMPSGTTYTMDMLTYKHEELVSRYVCDISDSSIAKAIAILKKFINKIKSNGKSKPRIRQ